MNTQFNPLPRKLKYHGFQYTQLARTEHVALYEQKLDEHCVGYEVFIVKKVPEKVVKGRVIPAHEKWPSDEDFGYMAWALMKYENALKRFETLKTEYHEKSI